MDFTSIIIAIIGALAGGGLVSLLTIHETRKGLKIDNKGKEQDQFIKLVDELQDQNEKLNDRLEQKDSRILELEDANAFLHTKLDEVSTDRAICKILRCDTISCPNRVPPLGFKEMSVEEAITKTDFPE